MNFAPQPGWTIVWVSPIIVISSRTCCTRPLDRCFWYCSVWKLPITWYGWALRPVGSKWSHYTAIQLHTIWPDTLCQWYVVLVHPHIMTSKLMFDHIKFQTEMNEYNDVILPAKHDLEPTNSDADALTRKRALIFMALINVGEYWALLLTLQANVLIEYLFCFKAVVIALGTLTIWHAKLIRRGETSIEAHINASETKRLAADGKSYVNPYDFGPKRNFQLFLGLTNGR